MRNNISISKVIATAAASLAALLVLVAPATAQSKRAQRQRGCCLVGSASSLPGKPLPGNLNTVWEAALLQDADEMSKLFGVRVHMFYLQETGGANAFSTAQTFPDLLAAEGCSEEECPDGTVFFGLDLIAQEDTGTKGSLFSLPAILAHEFGHSMQNKNNFPINGKWRELHADFLAGYFIGHRSRFGHQNVDQAAQTLFDKGDNDFNNPGHHGTKEERKSAFLAGFELNRRSRGPSGAAAYNAGLRYIQSQGASLSQ